MVFLYTPYAFLTYASTSPLSVFTPVHTQATEVVAVKLKIIFQNFSFAKVNASDPL
jgi:hypothetical protein